MQKEIYIYKYVTHIGKYHISTNEELSSLMFFNRNASICCLGFFVSQSNRKKYVKTKC